MKPMTMADMRREQCFRNCRAALRQIDVPMKVIEQFSPGPLLDQFCHLTIMLDPPLHWRDALIWIHDHRGEILKHAEGFLKDASGPATSKAD